MSIPKVLGQGTYGCVHNPPLFCDKSDKRDDENVSKLMKTKAAKTELNEYVVIDNIDKSKDFYLGKPDMCKLGMQKLNRLAIRNCSIRSSVDSNYNNYSLLLMKNGGLNLADYAKKVSVLDNNFLKELHRMFIGLIKVKEHKVIHHDLKAQNIVYNKENNLFESLGANYVLSFICVSSDCVAN